MRVSHHHKRSPGRHKWPKRPNNNESRTLERVRLIVEVMRVVYVVWEHLNDLHS